MVLTLLKAVIIGIAAAIPVGPLAILVFQKSISQGRGAGMRCAFGAIFSDFIYALFSVFAYAFISKFIKDNMVVIEIVGGLIIAIVGVSMVLSKPVCEPHHIRRRRKLSGALDITKSILMGFANPGCLAWMIALFAAFQMDVLQEHWSFTLLVLLCVSVGSVLYWFGFTTIAAKGNGRVKVGTLLNINRISGYAVIAFGLFALVRGILEL